MIAFLTGRFLQKTPAQLLVDVQGVGYEVNISLHTYAGISAMEQGTLLTWLQVKEDGFTLYGFHTPAERSLFLHLISVSGVGAATARMMLSSMKPQEITRAIVSGDERSLERIKGIGAKSAKRLILELREKLLKSWADLPAGDTVSAYNNAENDALNALMSLGIARAAAQEALRKTLKSHPDLGLEELIKLALKTL